MFALIHSPLVGPTTWSLVAKEIRKRGIDAIVPSLHDSPCDTGPYWQRHVASVTLALRGCPADQPVVLVAHSGAGPLLPLIGRAIEQRVAAYIFVDAALPGRDGQSRLDLFEMEEAAQFRRAESNGMIPAVWRNDALLRTIGIENAALRAQFGAEVPDVPLAVYEEPLPVPDGWPDAACDYVSFSVPYEREQQRARARGWPVRQLAGGHFHMLVQPVAVTDVLLDLVSELGA